jgi:hypothetical protein
MKQYTLTGPEPEDPTYLNITTDDSGLIIEVTIPFYRQADAVTKKLLREWQEYALGTGSPALAQDIVQFKEYITATYGNAYRVRETAR